MTYNEFLTSTALIVGAMGLFSLLEFGVPLFAGGAIRQGRAAANYGLTALTLSMNWGLSSLAAVFAVALSLEGDGLLVSLDLPGWGLIATSVLVLDFSTYLAHRSMHAIPALWKLHRVHHSDPFVDVSTTLRQHPLEGVWRFLWVVVPAGLLGLPAIGLVLYRGLSAVQAVFEHANVRVSPKIDRPLSLVWVTPDMHKIHHSRRQRQTDSNYGNLFALYDRVLGTFTPSEEVSGIVYGLADADLRQAKSFRGVMAMPFS